jgi:hypothetical protein
MPKPTIPDLLRILIGLKLSRLGRLGAWSACWIIYGKEGGKQWKGTRHSSHAPDA